MGSQEKERKTQCILLWGMATGATGAKQDARTVTVSGSRRQRFQKCLARERVLESRDKGGIARLKEKSRRVLSWS